MSNLCTSRLSQHVIGQRLVSEGARTAFSHRAACSFLTPLKCCKDLLGQSCMHNQLTDCHSFILGGQAVASYVYLCQPGPKAFLLAMQSSSKVPAWRTASDVHVNSLSYVFSCVFGESDVPGAALQAAELFEVENQSSEASKCRMKIAQFSAELERFPVAIEIFESIAKSQVENNLLKYSAKGNLLNAGLCRLNGEDCWNAIGRAIQMKSSSLLSALLCKETNPVHWTAQRHMQLAHVPMWVLSGLFDFIAGKSYVRLPSCSASVAVTLLSNMPACTKTVQQCCVFPSKCKVYNQQCVHELNQVHSLVCGISTT